MASQFEPAILLSSLVSTLSGLAHHFSSDGRPIKIRPENPGGRQYPHQDLVIYNSFRSDISEKETYLKKSPEKPLNLLTLTAEEKPKLIEDQSVQLITVSEDDISKTNYQAIDDVKKIITNSKIQLIKDFIW